MLEKKNQLWLIFWNRESKSESVNWESCDDMGCIQKPIRSWHCWLTGTNVINFGGIMLAVKLLVSSSQRYDLCGGVLSFGGLAEEI